MSYSNTVEIQSNFLEFDKIMPIRNHLLIRKKDDLTQNSAKNKQKTQKLLQKTVLGIENPVNFVWR